MEIRVNATRMELLKLRRRLDLARRGHKLLKDKLDGLVQHFIKTAKEMRKVYDELRPDLLEAFSQGTFSAAGIDRQALQAAILYPAFETTVEEGVVNIMGVRVPKYEIRERGEIRCFGGMFFTESFVDAVGEFRRLLPKMVLLAELFKTLVRVGQGIVEIRRRVNALEYILIPELEAKAGYIKMRLAEMERETIISLMKIKEMVIG